MWHLPAYVNWSLTEHNVTVFWLVHLFENIWRTSCLLGIMLRTNCTKLRKTRHLPSGSSASGTGNSKIMFIIRPISSIYGLLVLYLHYFTLQSKTMQKILLLLSSSFYKRRNWDSENPSNLQLLNREAGQVPTIYIEHERSVLLSPVSSKKTDNCKEYDQDKRKSGGG